MPVFKVLITIFLAALNAILQQFTGQHIDVKNGRYRVKNSQVPCRWNSNEVLGVFLHPRHKSFTLGRTLLNRLDQLSNIDTFFAHFKMEMEKKLTEMKAEARRLITELGKKHDLKESFSNIYLEFELYRYNIR